MAPNPPLQIGVREECRSLQSQVSAARARVRSEDCLGFWGHILLDVAENLFVGEGGIKIYVGVGRLLCSWLG